MTKPQAMLNETAFGMGSDRAILSATSFQYNRFRLLSKDMTTVAILPTSDANGDRIYQAIAGDKHSIGKTAGEALDALTAQIGSDEFSTLMVIQNFRPDWFFGVEQQQRLSQYSGQFLRQKLKLAFYRCI